MPRYAVKFSTVTGKTTIHAQRCREGRWREGFEVVLYDGPDAALVAVRVERDASLTKRGFPYPQLCPCLGKTLN